MTSDQSEQQIVRFFSSSSAAISEGIHYDTASGTEWYDAPSIDVIRPETGVRTGRRIGEVIYPD